MNENIDLTKILKDCPKGTKLYSIIYGDVEFYELGKSSLYPIILQTDNGFRPCVTKYGMYAIDYENKGECTLFPSRDQRDWSKFTAPWYKKEKFDPKTFQPFDKVLARIDGDNAYCWFADFVSTPTIEKYDLLPCIMSNKDANMIIPYNDETKHLVGTTDEAPEYYRYWEDLQ